MNDINTMFKMINDKPVKLDESKSVLDEGMKGSSGETVTSKSQMLNETSVGNKRGRKKKDI